jgi:hypothetical protein
MSLSLLEEEEEDIPKRGGGANRLKDKDRDKRAKDCC